MALDIGLHLLGGDPMGYYRQPPEVRLDLEAYWLLQNDPESRARWLLMAPLRLSDLSLLWVKTKVLDLLAGFRVWLGGNGVKFKEPRSAPAPRKPSIEAVAKRNLQLANAKRCGASKKAVAFWLGG